MLTKYLSYKNSNQGVFHPLNLQPCFKKNKQIKNLNGNFQISKKYLIINFFAIIL